MKARRQASLRNEAGRAQEINHHSLIERGKPRMWDDRDICVETSRDGKLLTLMYKFMPISEHGLFTKG